MEVDVYSLQPPQGVTYSVALVLAQPIMKNWDNEKLVSLPR
jgi:hypothetical protein